ncbi:type II 3-dehydroquinate dehydratase [Parasporobacterium paucivorans]|uniref:3-dehydroquinate dehydratase n=1 Tax=Parasporobacterium paucivorans DSM 15970 TaxID=1122934 RepID=A0A1M6DPG4_9FIRM|nr:type II 3-dehydroquinate dehydratase [Parasporobacterium paucivorans]SHI75101.1 3-dehydroquinate dehydratase [Parasporobacterium paucivorans DSM 15970]
MHKKILLINGPNLNMLGKREKEHYGHFTLEDAIGEARRTAGLYGFTVEDFQSNHEGSLIDKIHSSLGAFDGLIINAGAFTHYSYALLDALKLCSFPCVELHISDIHVREEFRKISVIRPACSGQISGLGIKSYHYAIIQCIGLIDGSLQEVRDGRTDGIYHEKEKNHES